MTGRYTAAQRREIEQAQSIANDFYTILRQFERGRITCDELSKYIFKYVTRHKYSVIVREMATELLRANTTLDFKQAAEKVIIRIEM